MSAITIDGTEYPVLLLTIAEHITVADIHGYGDQLEVHFKRRGDIAMVVDARGVAASLFSAEHRRALADQRKQIDARHPGRVKARAFIISNAVARGVLTAIFWLSPPTCPTEVFSDVTEARRWAAATLGATSAT